MTNQSSNSLLPTEDEIRAIMTHVVLVDPTKFPVPMMQIQFGHLMLNCLNQFKEEVNKSSEQFGNEVEKIFNQFKDELEKAIKRLEDAINK